MNSVISSSSSSSHDPVLTELVQYSSQALLQKEAEQLADSSITSQTIAARNSIANPVVSSKPLPSALTLTSQSHSYAAPLSPLRDRDLKALTDLFGQEAIDEIEADILKHLLSFFPEPCWEDYIFDFLKGYL